jgi:outer membrane protein assembly factor BamB
MASPPNRPVQVGVVLGILLVVASITLFAVYGSTDQSAAGPTTTDPFEIPIDTTIPADPTPTNGDDTTTTTTTTVGDPALHRWVDRRTVGQPWGDAVDGLITFRGNPTGTFYGTGPLPSAPEVKWVYPDTPACGQSTDLGVTSTWCGNGWTGQPVVWERPDGITELMIGAYDYRFHFIDAATGTRTRSPFRTGDLVKGSPSLDPDGYPLVYFGSRDGRLRILGLDRDDPVELWSFEAPRPLCTLADRHNHGHTCWGMWNNDWDAAPRVLNDVLFASGENSVFYIWKLNRTFDALGLVRVDPELLVEFPAWNDDLIAKMQDGCTVGIRCISTSIESTPVFFEGRVYFGTSAGWVFGLDITNVEDGEAPVVFEYWVGDDVDGSIVIDEEGMLYVPVEWKRFLPRGREVGQVAKLDPYTSGDPLVWSWFSLTDPPAQGGLWSTPALGDGVLYVTTHRGFLCAVDTETGDEVWCHQIAPGTWSSPVVVDDRLLVVDNQADMRLFDITDPRSPRLLWTHRVGTHQVEATPAVWKGRIYVWNRDGHPYAIGQRTG